MTISRYDVSPDGSEVVYSTFGAHEDLFSITVDEGVALSRDGKALFYISRSPQTEIWMAKTE